MIGNISKSKGFKGDKGDPPRKGIDYQDGYTPKKGVDYFTEVDKQEIVQEVIQEIGVPESSVEINSETVSAMTEILFDAESIVEISPGEFDGTNAAIVDFKAVITVDGVEKTITKDTDGLDGFVIVGDYNRTDNNENIKDFSCRTLPFELEPYDDYIIQVFHIVYNGVDYYTWNFTLYLAKNYSKLATTKFVKEQVAFEKTKADKDMRNVGADGAKYLQYITFKKGEIRDVPGYDSFDGTNHNLIDFKIVTTINGVETTLTKDTEGVTYFNISGGFNGKYIRDITDLPFALSGTGCMVDIISVVYNGKTYSNYDSTTTYFALVVEDMNNIVDDKLATKTEVLALIKSNSLTKEDKEELIQDVISALPIYNGEVVL